MIQAPSVAPPSPFRGLRAFDESELDTMFFFGRERDTETITANVLAARFAVLFGPPGVGKSSILHAAVVRRVRALVPDALVVVHDSWAGDPSNDLWRSVAAAARVDSPAADDPLVDRLERLTSSHGGDLYLLLDQFEELFTYANAATLTAELSDVVNRSGLRVNVLVAVRDDALSELDAFTGRVPDVFGNALPLERLDRAAGKDAITGPIMRWNELSSGPRVAIEPELVEAVLDQVTVGRVALGGVAGGAVATGETGGIEASYLQIVMQRLWEADRDPSAPVLRARTLAELGGAQEIIRSHFERAVEALTPRQRDIASRVFNQLVTPSGTKIAHRADDLARYADVDEAELRPVFDALGADRLLRRLDDHVEIFHDVLADAVLAWRARHDEERALARERVESDRRQRRTLRMLAAALVALTAMAAVAVYALTQRAHARDRAAAAYAAAQRATARTLDAQAAALIPILAARRDPELGLLLAADAGRLSPTAEADDILRRALLASFIRRVLPERGVVDAAFDRSAGRLVVASAGGTVAVYARGGRDRAATIRAGGSLLGASLSPDGRLVLTTSRGGPATIWDAQSGRLVRSFGRSANAAAFAADGSLVVTAEGRIARVWRVADGSLVTRVSRRNPIARVASSARGDLLVTSGADPLVQVFVVATGRLLAAVNQGAAVTSATISPDGQTLVTTGRNRVARSWSLRRHGRLEHEFRGHVGALTGAAVSPDGRLLLTTSTDGTARVWNLATGSAVTTLIGHTNRVEGGTFSGDGASVLTWSSDGTARLWRSDSDYTKAILAGPDLPVSTASFGAGDTVVTTAADGRVRLWDAPVQPALRKVADLARRVEAASFSGDGRLAVVSDGTGISVRRSGDWHRLAHLSSGSARAVAASRDGSLFAAADKRSVRVWSTAAKLRETVPLAATALALGTTGLLAAGETDGTVAIRPANGRHGFTLHGAGAGVTSLALGRGDGLLAAGYADGTVAVWRLDQRRRLFLRLQHRRGTPVKGVVFDAAGRRLATTGADSQVFVLDVAHGRQLEALRGHFATVSNAAFSPNGRWLLTAGPGSAGLWDLVNGQRLLFLDGHRGLLLAVAFDRTGHRVTTIGADGTLREYQCEVCGGTAALLRLADQRLRATGRTLTPDERRRYLGR